jgi:hypothetical protein
VDGVNKPPTTMKSNSVLVSTAERMVFVVVVSFSDGHERQNSVLKTGHEVTVLF